MSKNKVVDDIMKKTSDPDWLEDMSCFDMLGYQSDIDLAASVGHHKCPHCGQRSYYKDEACCYLCLKYKRRECEPTIKEVKSYWMSGGWKKTEAKYYRKRRAKKT